LYMVYENKDDWFKKKRDNGVLTISLFLFQK
jgi:hypothetical protein